MRTSSRRAAAAVAKIVEVDATRCFCGAAEFEFSFVRFPMQHVSRCRTCGLEHRCELKLTPARKTAQKSPDPQQPLGFPPFGY